MQTKLWRFVFGVMFTMAVAVSIIALQRGDYTHLPSFLVAGLVSLIFTHFWNS